MLAAQKVRSISGCSVLGITYQKKLNTGPHGFHANRSLFPLDGLCCLEGREAGKDGGGGGGGI